MSRDITDPGAPAGHRLTNNEPISRTDPIHQAICECGDTFTGQDQRIARAKWYQHTLTV